MRMIQDTLSVAVRGGDRVDLHGCVSGCVRAPAATCVSTGQWGRGGPAPLFGPRGERERAASVVPASDRLPALLFR